MNIKIITASVLALLLTACSWVKLTPEGREVQVARAGEVGNCTKLGKINVSLKHKVGRVERKQDKVAVELTTLGKNEGAAMGGDTIVAQSKISDGRQEFGVYDC